MASSHRRSDQTADDEMMAQPQVFDLMMELNHFRRTATQPTSVDEQAQHLAMAVDWQQAQQQAHRQEIMAADDTQFNEAAVDEAVRSIKRRRTASNTVDLTDARKAYSYGPEERPDSLGGSIDGLILDTQLLTLSGDFDGGFSIDTLDLTNDAIPSSSAAAYKPGFDLLESICSHIWLATEVGKHMRPRDIVNLFSVSRSFHTLVRQHWQSTIIAWGEHMAPSSLKIFFWKFYSKYAVQDPTGTTWAAPGPFMADFPRPAWAAPARGKAGDANIRLVPGLRYLAMIVERETRVRDILACLARSGHRLPPGTHRALKKMWLLMDISTNNLRRAFIRNEELWPREDLYRAQALLIKLQMRFNEPLFGPDTPGLLETLMGSRDGLTPLWALLRSKRFTRNLVEAVQERARYHCHGDAAARARDAWEDYLGVPAWDLGFGHLEGWGEGQVHLSRPDELVVEEAVRRGLALKDHLPFMVFWGHVDWKKRVNIAPSEDEMYMSDDSLPPLNPVAPRADAAADIRGRCGNVPFEHGDWLPVHALKARWDSLTDEQREAINEADRADDMKMLAWDGEDEGFFDPDPADAPAAPRRPDEGPDGEVRFLDEETDDEIMVCHDGRDDGGINESKDQGKGGTAAVGDGSGAAPAGVKEAAILEAWDKLAPGQKRRIAAAHGALQSVEGGAAGDTTTTTLTTVPAAPIKTLYPRDYRISDPTSLALLRRYEVFPPAVLSPTAEGPHGSSEEEEEEDEDEDEDDGDESGEEESGSGDDSDDDALKALADESGSDDDVVIDVDRYKSYLAEAGERRWGSHPYDDGAEEDGEDVDMDGAAVSTAATAGGTRTPMFFTDVRYC